MSVDVEGAEERVLGGFPFDEYRFKCITIERPANALRNVLTENGYVLIKEIPGLDCFYVHGEFIDHYRENLFSFYTKKYLAICME